MKTNFRKWSRLLSVAIMVIAMLAMILPTAVQAQGPIPGCETCPTPACELVVNIVTPVEGEEIQECETFWVNATVARPLGYVTIEDVYAEISFESEDGGSAEVINCNVTQGPVTLNDCYPVADFWWQVRCTNAGATEIEVYAYSTTTTVLETCPSYPNYIAGEAEVEIEQVLNPCEESCLTVEIVNSPAIDEQIVHPSDEFEIKANICNICDETVNARIWIEWTPESGASMISGAPEVITTLRPGDVNCCAIIGWTFHCEEGGDVEFTVYAEQLPLGPPPSPAQNNCEAGICVVSDSEIVHQVCPADLEVTLEAPEKAFGTTECQGPYTVTATLCDPCGDTGLTDIAATLYIAGPALIVGDNAQSPVGYVTRTNCPDIAAGECVEVSWQIIPQGEGEVCFYVIASGLEEGTGRQIIVTSDTECVEQVSPLMVNITAPEDELELSVCQTFDVTYTVANGTKTDIDTNIWTGIALPENVEILEGSTVDITYCAISGIQPKHLDPIVMTVDQLEAPAEVDAYVNLGCLCDCCYATVTWHLVCVGPSENVEDSLCEFIADEIFVMAGLDSNDLTTVSDYDDVEVIQMCKAHLTASLQAYEGTLEASDPDAFCAPMDPESAAVAVGESFTVIAAISNLGQAAAEDVTIGINVVDAEGNDVVGELVSTNDALTQEILEIGCHGSTKVIWEFVCLAEGPVYFVFDTLTGYDANFDAPIPEENIDWGCSIVVDQIPLEVEITQPLPPTNEFIAPSCFIDQTGIQHNLEICTEGDVFTIGARIENNDSNRTLECVYAELHYDFGIELYSGQSAIVDLGRMLPGDVAYATWQVQCTAPGETNFYVTVFTEPCVDCQPAMDVNSDVETIIQYPPAAICCDIVSPQLNDYDLCLDLDDDIPLMPEIEAYVATGQEFEVTAKIFNSNSQPVSIDFIEVFSACDSFIECNGGCGDIECGNFEVIACPDYPFVLAPHESTVVSFNLRGTAAGLTDIVFHVEGSGELCTTTECFSAVTVMFYPAAFLTVDLLGNEEVEVGDNFTVTAHIENIGGADASTVKATLNISNNLISLTSGGLTKDVGPLGGHYATPDTEEVTWNLHCNGEGFTTLNVTLTGYDEYGYQVKQLCTTRIILFPVDVLPGIPIEVACCTLQLHGHPLLAINPSFLEQGSLTIEQVGAGNGNGGEEPPVVGDEVVIELEQGWNLISSPWYIDSPVNPNVVFGSLSNPALYAYSACSQAWSYWPNNSAVWDDGKGYWLYTDAAGQTLTLNGVIAPEGGMPPSYRVCEGWNLIGYKIGTQTKTLGTYLGGLNFVSAWTYDGGQWIQVLANDNLVPGQGYWVAFTGTSASSYIYP